jgi:hypothetical protein
MTNIEQFEQARRVWSETLAPETAVERRLVNLIARQDWLLFRSSMRAVATDSSLKAGRYENRHKELAVSIASLIGAVNVLQQRRADANVPPPPPPAAAVKAKVFTMPKRVAAVAHIRNPEVTRLDLEGLPRLHPFGSARVADRNEPSLRGSLEIPCVA